MLDLENHAKALARLATAAQSIADGVNREMGGEIARQASMLAVDLQAAARSFGAGVEQFRAELRRLRYYDPAGPTVKRCPRCKAVLGVDGICEQCEGIRG